MDKDQLVSQKLQQSDQLLLDKLRRIMNSIYELGSIWYDSSRLAAYGIVAIVASDYRKEINDTKRS